MVAKWWLKKEVHSWRGRGPSGIRISLRFGAFSPNLDLVVIATNKQRSAQPPSLPPRANRESADRPKTLCEGGQRERRTQKKRGSRSRGRHPRSLHMPAGLSWEWNRISSLFHGAVSGSLSAHWHPRPPPPRSPAEPPAEPLALPCSDVASEILQCGRPSKPGTDGALGVGWVGLGGEIRVRYRVLGNKRWLAPCHIRRSRLRFRGVRARLQPARCPYGGMSTVLVSPPPTALHLHARPRVSLCYRDIDAVFTAN